ncbi:hypothetical protein NECAME_09448 [Necator americanus]|uniref:Uncharacterized protein n=1 Tax=Necator americanus TaxID=51031 RepID=W2TFW1_NECAM|nr:hypothetical protein NECAME_09448 [Necator americanus]ETN80081.1 hypothetical protein NECAME_09448 [Necator americanus]
MRELRKGGVDGFVCTWRTFEIAMQTSFDVVSMSIVEEHHGWGNMNYSNVSVKALHRISATPPSPPPTTP